MIDHKALILIAHSDGRTLLALYSILDAEGYFVAPCFSTGELLRYCSKYQPSLVMTSKPSFEGGDDRLLEAIQKRSSKTKVLFLPEMLLQRSEEPLFEAGWNDDILRSAATVYGDRPSLHPDGL